jgi:Tfp pilus assembly protein PilO
MAVSTRSIVAGLAVVLAALAFWFLLLAPKRDEAAKLSDEVTQLEASVANARIEVSLARQAKRTFPQDYQQLVVLGKAVPAGDETAALLVELNGVSDRAGVKFQSIALEGGGGEPAPVPAPDLTSGEPSVTDVPGESGSTTVAATEAAAALMPLGASVGPAGLGVMPYSLTFHGSFFNVADFIAGIDGMVNGNGQSLAVDGRLVTIDGFSLSADPEKGFPDLQADFQVTTYVSPPGQGLTAGATPGGPAPAGEATTVATTTTTTP